MGKNWGVICRCVSMLLLASMTTQAQDVSTPSGTQFIQLQIQPLLHNKVLVLGQKVFIPLLNDSIQIDRLRFYLSDISFSTSSGTTGKTEQRFFLIDLENPTSLMRSLPMVEASPWDRIHFQIGVDSATQMQGVQGGDLDPMHGMYWSWRSGYVNFKCEGTSPICPGRNKEFLFHIGGFQAPFNTLQSVDLPVYSDTVVIQIDLTPLFTLPRITQNYNVMSPNAKAMTFALQLPFLFHSKP